MVIRAKKVLEIAKGLTQDNAVWFMRQAGRYLPGYESLKAGRSFMNVMKDPDTIAKVSALPLSYFHVDALVVFTDILLPFTRIGYDPSYEGGIALKETDGPGFDYYAPLAEGLKRTSKDYADKTIIGVVGGPFTTLSYLYDGGKDGYRRTKEAIVKDQSDIISGLTEAIIQFAKLQIEAGADMIQIFDSWLGGVSTTYYLNHLAENESYFVKSIKKFGKPVVFFAEGASHLYGEIVKLDPDVYSLDWRTDLIEFGRIAPGSVVQGNLDPYLLGASDEYLKLETKRIMAEGRNFKGHIFNLGHGVQPWTDWKKLALVTEEVHGYER